jgi:hypothetical protein
MLHELPAKGMTRTLQRRWAHPHRNNSGACSANRNQKMSARRIPAHIMIRRLSIEP